MYKRITYKLKGHYKRKVDLLISRPILVVIILFSFIPTIGSAQVGINTTNVDFSSILDIQSTDKGVLFPRLTAAQKNAMGTVPAGLMIYCSDCCVNGTGSLYQYNGTNWGPLDSSCVDNGTPECYSMVTTIVNDNHMDSDDTPPLLIDGNTTLASQPDDDDDLRMHKTTDDLVTFDFPENLPAGYKVRLYFNDNEKPMNGSGFRLGLFAQMINNGTANQTINTDTGLLPGSVITNISGNDYYVEIVLSDNTDELFVRSANDDRDHVVFLEIKVFDSNDVEIALSCP
tara:strand:- start:879 stop:1736 length:858 start_codon:yes stop_codon:yes gene_type:complete